MNLGTLGHSVGRLDMRTDRHDTSFVGPLDGGRRIRNLTGGRGPMRHRPFLRALLTATVMAVAPVLCGGLDDATAQRVIQIGGPKRTGSVHVYIGKSEDVRTDQSFVDIVVGDPEIATSIRSPISRLRSSAASTGPHGSRSTAKARS